MENINRVKQYLERKVFIANLLTVHVGRQVLLTMVSDVESAVCVTTTGAWPLIDKASVCFCARFKGKDVWDRNASWDHLELDSEHN